LDLWVLIGHAPARHLFKTPFTEAFTITKAVHRLHIMSVSRSRAIDRSEGRTSYGSIVRRILRIFPVYPAVMAISYQPRARRLQFWSRSSGAFPPPGSKIANRHAGPTGGSPRTQLVHCTGGAPAMLPSTDYACTWAGLEHLARMAVLSDSGRHDPAGARALAPSEAGRPLSRRVMPSSPFLIHPHARWLHGKSRRLRYRHLSYHVLRVIERGQIGREGRSPQVRLVIAVAIVTSGPEASTYLVLANDFWQGGVLLRPPKSHRLPRRCRRSLLWRHCSWIGRMAFPCTGSNDHSAFGR